MPVKTKPKKKTRQNVLSEFRTTEILEAARRVFSKKGFDASLVDDIAAEARVAKGTIYLYFKSKSEIYDAALTEDFAALRKLKKERLATPGKVRERLRSYISASLEFCERRRDFIRIFLMESGMSCSVLSPKRIREHRKEDIAAIALVLQEAIDKREIRPVNPYAVAQFIVYALKGLIETSVLDKPSATPETDLQIFLDLIFVGINPAS